MALAPCRTMRRKSGRKIAGQSSPTSARCSLAKLQPLMTCLHPNGQNWSSNNMTTDQLTTGLNDWKRKGLIAGVALLVVCGIIAIFDFPQFLRSYLIGYLFC